MVDINASRIFEDVDGDGEPTLWLENGDYPQPILRKCDLNPPTRGLWSLIVAAVTSATNNKENHSE